MSTKNDSHQLFIRIMDSLSISQGELAKWMSQANTKQTRESVSRKYRGDTGVTKTDISLMNALKILEQDGYDLKSVEFTEQGIISRLNKK
ncbi:MAG: hypothetical protein QM500_19910 [Methylococcales bacterium]